MPIKRAAESIDPQMWIKADRISVVTLCEAILRIFRDEGGAKIVTKRACCGWSKSTESKILTKQLLLKSKVTIVA